MNLINRLARLSGGLALTVVLSACQQTPAPAPHLANQCQPQGDAHSAACQWSEALQQKLNKQFQDAARYAGQHCWVRLEWQNSGRFAVTQTQGDEALCLRAWQLIGQSRGLPPPPQRDQPAWFGFAPTRPGLPAHPGATGAG
ncbi:cell envelope integrity TolA C-terminal domain-containing protein [Pantoea dispersa]